MDINGFGWDMIRQIAVTTVIAALGAILAMVLRLPFAFRGRKHVLRFFGVKDASSPLAVYLSALFIRDYGSEDFRHTARNYCGSAVPAYEFKLIEPVGDLFSDPFLDGLSRAMRSWLTKNVSWRLGVVKPIFLESPASHKDVVRRSSLIVGSRYYNSAADLYCSTCNPMVSLNMVEDKVTVASDLPDDPNYYAYNDEIGVIEKLYDHYGNCIILAAGLGKEGTTGAVLYLIRNWRRLQKEFGDKSFVVCLRFEQLSDHSYSIDNPVRLIGQSTEKLRKARPRAKPHNKGLKRTPDGAA